MAVPVRTPGAAPRSVLRAVVVPDEHGGWGLTLEPVLLGLLVAPSWPGLVLAPAALAAFLVRTPLKVVLVDRWRRRSLPRTRAAATVAARSVAAIPFVRVELDRWRHGTAPTVVSDLAGVLGVTAAVAAVLLDDRLVAGAVAGAGGVAAA